LINGHYDRLHHLLSDHELVAFGFASMLPALCDLREQYPLSTEDRHLADEHPQLMRHPYAEGTQSIAAGLGIKHPVVRKGDDAQDWVMSTDLVLSLMPPNGAQELLAVSVKYASELTGARTTALLTLEREYWRRRGVPWILLTEDQYIDAVGLSIRAGLPWTMEQPSSTTDHLRLCALLSPKFRGLTLKEAFSLIEVHAKVDFQRHLGECRAEHAFLPSQGDFLAGVPT